MLILNGSNAFTGTTTVSGGTLVVGDAAHSGGLLIGDVAVNSGTVLQGHSTIRANVTNSGTVMPGGSIGTLAVTANYTQNPGGTLEMEVSPPGGLPSPGGGGRASLAGALKLDFDSGTYGTGAYTIVSANAVTGTFGTMSQTGLPPDHTFGIQYNPTTVSLIVAPTNSGQLYTDFTADTFDTAEALNDMVFTHLGTRYCHDEGGTGHPELPACPEIAIWQQAFGLVGAHSGGSMADAVSSRGVGAMAGVDFQLDLGFDLGLTVAYVRSELGTAGGGGHVSTDSFAFAMNGSVPLMHGRMDANGFWILNDGRARRDVSPANGLALSAKAHPKTKVFCGALQYSHAVIFDDLTALGRLVYTNADGQAFRETGAAPFDVAIGSKSVASFYGDAGLRLSHIYRLKSGAQVIPELMLGARGRFGDLSHQATASFATAEGPGFLAPGVQSDRVSLIAELGAAVQKGQEYGVYLRGSTRIGDSQQEAIISFGGRLNF